ncbi:MAG: hypothetical protein HYY40_08950 [Bacteroidetes bacterium]|nr:hypothetical protein [Bacteroidota bacterium]
MPSQNAKDESDSLGDHNGYCKKAKVSVRFALSSSTATEGIDDQISIEIVLSAPADQIVSVGVIRKSLDKCIDPIDPADCGLQGDFIVSFPYGTTCGNSNLYYGGIGFESGDIDTFLNVLIFNDPFPENDKGVCFSLVEIDSETKVDKDFDTHLLIIKDGEIQDMSDNDNIEFPIAELLGDKIILRGIISDDFNLSLYNVLGEVFFRKNIITRHNQSKMEISCGPLNDGLYFLSMINNRNHVATKLLYAK